jgi:hypothetical protein
MVERAASVSNSAKKVVLSSRATDENDHRKVFGFAGL